MRRARTADGRHRARPPSARRRASTLDARAVEAVARFVRVLARCGCTPQDIGTEVLKACRAVPKSWVKNASAAVREMDKAAHMLTFWFSDPAYLDASGHPRPLALRGASASLEALAQRVDRHLEVTQLVPYLVRRGVLRRVRSRYVPRDRILSVRGTGGPHHTQSLRGLLAMLRTVEHNHEPGHSTPGWFEVLCVNPRFPGSAVAAFDKRFRRRAEGFVFQVDADMHRRERARKKGERTVALGVGVYRFEEDPIEPRPRQPRRPKS